MQPVLPTHLYFPTENGLSAELVVERPLTEPTPGPNSILTDPQPWGWARASV